MKTAAVPPLYTDRLNTGFLFLSLLPACLAPLETFLFAYGILGPLHYLTEISWLHDRRYFARHAADPVILTLLVVISLLLPLLLPESPLLSLPVIFAFLYGALAAFLPGIRYRRLLAPGLLMAGMALSQLPLAVLVLAILVPTYIHVFLFTTLFMLWGALKSGSRPALLNVGLHIGIMVFLLEGANLLPIRQPLSPWSVAAFAPFLDLNRALLDIWSGTKPDDQAVLISPAGQGLLRFMAFAYLFHYLNWFSKTEVIGWHRIRNARWALILGIWICSVGLYTYDYVSGFKVLLFLSLLHVMLEFPLNHVSFAGIYSHLASRRL